MIRDELLLSNLIKELGIGEELSKFLNYIELIKVWSKKINLISDLDNEKIIRKQIIPSLLMVHQVKALPHAKILDLGAGAGFPGIPLKLALPKSYFVLVESRRRRANFLKDVVRRLELTKINVVNQRLEEWCPKTKNGKIDLVVSKAVGYNEKLYSSLGLVINKSGHIIYTLKSIEYTRLEKKGTILNRTRVWNEITTKWAVETI